MHARAVLHGTIRRRHALEASLTAPAHKAGKLAVVVTILASDDEALSAGSAECGIARNAVDVASGRPREPAPGFLATISEKLREGAMSASTTMSADFHRVEVRAGAPAHDPLLAAGLCWGAGVRLPSFSPAAERRAGMRLLGQVGHFVISTSAHRAGIQLLGKGGSPLISTAVRLGAAV